MQLLIQLLILTLILLKLMLKLTLLRLLVAHPQAVMEEETVALSNSVPEDADGHFLTSSARLQFSHGRRDYGPVVQGPAERPDTPNIRWCSRR